MSEEKKGFFTRLKEGLTKTRNNIVSGIDSVFSGFSSIDDDFYEELEEILIMGDIGINATTSIIENLKKEVAEQHIKEPMECKQLLIESIKEQMQVDETAYNFEKEQSVIMVIGVNGVGKTTSVGKLAGKLKDEGRKVLIAAADTFRAAAGDQLAEWASRADVPMIGGKEGADPASVVFDAVNAAKARGVDVLLVDTAGRLHNKKNLMEELRKMNRIIDKEFPNAHRENLIVLDGTTGQNALVQAREFGEVADLTGIILTKMDGTAKGGIVNLTRSLGNSWARDGITVNCICPGYFPTEMTAAYIDAPFFHQAHLECCPMERHGKTGEMDGLCTYFASPACSYTTGQIVCVDGGWSAI